MKYRIDRDYDLPPGRKPTVYGGGGLSTAIERAKREIVDCPTEGQALISVGRDFSTLSIAPVAAYVIYEGGKVRVEYPPQAAE